MTRSRRTDLLWLIGIVLAVAIGSAAVRLAGIAHRGPLPEPRPRDLASANADWAGRLSVQHVHIDISGHDALEAANQAMKDSGKWDFPHIHLDPQHRVAAVSGHTLELDGQPLLAPGMDQPQINRLMGSTPRHLDSDAVWSFERGDVYVEVTVRVDGLSDVKLGRLSKLRVSEQTFR